MSKLPIGKSTELSLKSFHWNYFLLQTQSHLLVGWLIGRSCQTEFLLVGRSKTMRGMLLNLILPEAGGTYVT